MQEYEYLFSKSLHEALKEKIKASIFCKVIDDVLIVDITTKKMISNSDTHVRTLARNYSLIKSHRKVS